LRTVVKRAADGFITEPAAPVKIGLADGAGPTDAVHRPHKIFN